MLSRSTARSVRVIRAGSAPLTSSTVAAGSSPGPACASAPALQPPRPSAATRTAGATQPICPALIAMLFIWLPLLHTVRGVGRWPRPHLLAGHGLQEDRGEEQDHD